MEKFQGGRHSPEELAERPQDRQHRLKDRVAQLIYLPPYSPDLNPIEKAWSKFKQYLRSAKARIEEALDQAITEALNTISADNAL